MISVERLGLAYGAHRVLEQTSLTIPEGELVLVVGPTGSGKSSLLRSLADPGLVRGAAVALSGHVWVHGRDLFAMTAPQRRALVGYVPQDPAGALGSGTVEDNLTARVDRRPDDRHGGARRVEETLDLLRLTAVRARRPAQLSGGEQQRVAIAAALVGGPRVLVLDEPTSALDPVASEEVLATLHRLVHDLGLTVVVAEHRLERVVHHADTVLLVKEGKVSAPLLPVEAMALSVVQPPVVTLGRALGWQPLALSVRQARRNVALLAPRLRTVTEVQPRAKALEARADGGSRASARQYGAAPAVSVRRLGVLRGQTVVLREVDLEVRPGEVVALMGRNGAGKSSLLGALSGKLAPTTGRVALRTWNRPGQPSDGGTDVVLSPQDPWSILGHASVAEQVRAAGGAAQSLLDRLAPRLAVERAPAELSEGQRMCVALSLALARPAPLVLMDEPTRGLDYGAKARLVELVDELAAAGRTVVIATHDVELAAELASRVVVLAEGEIVVDGDPYTVLPGSPAFAPQVAKIFSPRAYLTVADVLGSLPPGDQSPRGGPACTRR
ncbi:ABC transporter ATP-binding protein [Pedococcus sp. 5OH_020]|uniref:ABC transporter ATP-binding protein n=1 Tax=Pedococcus sp. 5OH_020 TaxID=2989814 RepID=UPI0022EA022C|nr:ATP-binding cassette domain-containing protein [Pedococcus sp. 5OH_020]